MPYLVVSRVERGQVFTLPLRDIRGVTTIDENAVMVSTYLPEENAWYYKTISVIGGETMKKRIRTRERNSISVRGS